MPRCLLALLPVILWAMAGGAWAQQPGQGGGAFQSSCRADYQSFCSNVRPDGRGAVLICLREHAASLSPACGQALAEFRASRGGGVAGPAASPNGYANPMPLAGRSPAPATTTPASGTDALRDACRVDYRRLCSTVDVGGGHALTCLKDHSEALSPACRAGLAQLPPS